MECGLSGLENQVPVHQQSSCTCIVPNDLQRRVGLQLELYHYIVLGGGGRRRKRQKRFKSTWF